MTLTYLPGLVKHAVEGVVGDGAKKVVFQAVPAGVRAIWEKLSPKVEADARAKANVEAVAAQPEDEDSLVMLKLALKKVLEGIEKSEPELVLELRKLMDENQPGGTGGNSATVTAETVYSSVVGDGANVTQTIGLPTK